MALKLTPSSKRRTSVLLVGTFLLGAAGATFFDGRTTTPAYAQNLSEQVPQTASRNAPGFADIVDRVSPAVVSIQVKSHARRQLSSFEGTPFEHFFEEFSDRFGGNRERFGQQRRDRGRQFSMGQGSGFLISKDGYIVTNGHVVDGAEEVSVVLHNGDVLDAEVIGVDDRTDLALVKVKRDQDFPFVTFATHETRVGDWVMAVGNPFGLGGTVTAGIVSARGREIGAGPYDDFIQIDAPINRGNSGGPTFNLNGNVVGVNTAIYSPSGGSVGIGFAIPASIASNVVADLMDDGTVTRGWLGVQIQPITPEIAESLGRNDVVGALVTQPQSGSPADQAGLTAGDAILSVDGKKVDGPRDLARTISSRSPGDTVTLKIWRQGKAEDVDVKLGTLKADDGDNSERRMSRNEDRGASDVLGMTLAPTEDVGIDGPGLAVVEIDPEGAAAQAGIRVGDVILQAGGVNTADASDLENGIHTANREGRKNVLLKLQTGENTRFVALPVDEERS
ncbi:Do family serine endopeptidase [Acuticoccus mangrovi]|uniref:Probable periplasmic serine endoprotease DegP-like n=1 Tax=Acuticoccus mangrovi TaxID=2796142 RepID=A0A934ILD1_9HYPH|nr:Do family serine endopeptidase [Acuticoccus mangrovi]MBJ3774755.1 Do family serine endopeptidase [Acuticoccus mangrovi]